MKSSTASSYALYKACSHIPTLVPNVEKKKKYMHLKLNFLQYFLFGKFLLFMDTAVCPHYIHGWAEPEQLPLVWPVIDLWSSIFTSLWVHMPSLCLSFADRDEAFCPGGGGLGGLKSSAWCEGVEEWGVHAFCAACLVILWHHLSTS